MQLGRSKKLDRCLLMGVVVAALSIPVWISGASPATTRPDEAPGPSLSEADRADLLEFLAAKAHAPLSEESLADIVTEPFSARYRPTPSASKTKAKVGTCSCQHRDVHSSAGRSCQELREKGVCSGPYTGTGLNKAKCQADARDTAAAKCRNCLGHCHFTPAK